MRARGGLDAAAIIAESLPALLAMNPTLFKVVLVIVFLVVVYNLGQALYFMMTDRSSDGGKMAWALTRRIALSLLLIGLVVLGIWAGWLHPHGVGG
jgi:succinate dehydrogenase/fumarate reductase cytochrome b subunit